MTINNILFFCFLLLSLNSIGQNKSTDKKIDSLSIQIDNCKNCSSDLFARAELYIIKDKKMEAMKDLNKAIAIHIEYFIQNTFDSITLNRYYNERAYLKSDLNDYRGAIQDFDKSISMKVGYGSLWEKVYFGKGYCETKIENYESAIESYEKALLHNPNNEITYYNLGLIKIETGRKNEGCLNLSKAGELGLNDAYKIISENCN